MQTPIFVLLFLAPVYVPLALLTGWLKGAASINPITLIIDAGRGFISGEPDEGALRVRRVAGDHAAHVALGDAQMRRAERGVR